MKLSTMLAMAAIVAVPMGAAHAQATSKASGKLTLTGIDKIHDQVRVGNRICMADHDHRGAGELSSRRGAEGAAIRAWTIFTRDEYGTAWSNYALAVAKTMQCKEGGGRWTCNLSARPCRPAKI